MLLDVVVVLKSHKAYHAILLLKADLAVFKSFVKSQYALFYALVKVELSLAFNLKFVIFSGLKLK